MSFWADAVIGMFILVIAIGIITIGIRLVIIVIDIITRIFIKCFGSGNTCCCIITNDINTMVNQDIDNVKKICSGCFDICCICRCKCKSKRRKKVMPINYDEKTCYYN